MLKSMLNRIGFSLLAGTRLYEGEGGAAGGSGEQKIEIVKTEQMSLDDSVKAALAKDPEYQEIVAEEAKAKKKKVPAPEGELEVDPEPETPDDEKTPVEDESPEEGDDDDAEYEDDILEGITGDDFKSLPQSVKEAVATTREKLESVEKKASDAEKRLQDLLSDPVIRHRDMMRSAGRGDAEYDVPSLTKEELARVEDMVDSGDHEKVRQFFNAKLQAAAELGSNNARIQEKRSIDRDRTLESAAQKVLDIAKLNPKLFGEKLPSTKEIRESEDYSKLGALGKIVQTTIELQKKGVIASSAKYLAESSAEEVYAQMAARHKWPVVMNADEKIRTEIKKSNSALMDRFKKSRDGSGRLSAGTEVDRRSEAKGTKRNGVDLVKLATDDGYHESVMKQKMTPEWIQEVAKMRTEGERMLSDNPKLATPSRRR